MKNIRGRKAFTMIELIIVIVILGILAGIAIVGYGAVTGKANESAIEQAAGSLDREIRALAAFDSDAPSGHVTDAVGDLPLGVTTAVGTVATNVAVSKGGWTTCLQLGADATEVGTLVNTAQAALPAAGAATDTFCS